MGGTDVLETLRLDGKVAVGTGAGRGLGKAMAKAFSPEDLGPIAVWLAGTGVGYVTGQMFRVDGGLTQHL